MKKSEFLIKKKKKNSSLSSLLRKLNCEKSQQNIFIYTIIKLTLFILFNVALPYNSHDVLASTNWDMIVDFQDEKQLMRDNEAEKI